MKALRSAKRHAGFLTVTDGSAAIEFAVLLPVLLILLFGTVEISKYVHTTNQIVQTVSLIGQMASQLPGTAKVSDVQRIWSAAPLIAPESKRVAMRLGKSAWTDALMVTITHIVFTKRDASCVSDCEYEANVAWSVGQTPLSCAKLAMGQAIAPTTEIIPPEFFGSGSVLLVQASLPYVPQLDGTAHFLDGVATALTTTLTESSWFLPRNAPRISLSQSAVGSPRFNVCAV